MNHPINIRLAGREDIPAIHDIYETYATTTWFNTEEPPLSGEDFIARMVSIMKRYPCLVATHQNHVIGYTYASAFRARPAYDWTAELSIYIRHDWAGRRLGKVLYRTLIEILKRQGICNLYALVICGNKSSELLHDATGFDYLTTYDRVAYKKGKWLSVIVFYRRIGLLKTPPEPICPISGMDIEELALILKEANHTLNI